jgi:hypothetical protein
MFRLRHRGLVVDWLQRLRLRLRVRIERLVLDERGRYLFVGHAGQHVPRHVGRDRRTFGRLEAADQADRASRSTHLVPWEPEAVGVSQV